MTHPLRKKLRIIMGFMLMFTCAITLCSEEVSAFSKTNAVNYADTYWQNYNSAYPSFDKDCTNFVSQIMRAGGHKDNVNWYYNNRLSYSRTWCVADDLKNYLRDFGGYKLGSWSKYGTPAPYQTYAYIDNSSNLTNGDEVIFYDWTGNGIMNHASFCVRTGKCEFCLGPYGNGLHGDLINQHTKNRKNCVWHLDPVNTNRNTTRIYAFRVN